MDSSPLQAARIACLVLVGLFAIPSWAQGDSSSLSTLLQMGRRNAPELLEWQAKVEQANGSIVSAGAPYDLQVYGDTSFTRDRTEQDSLNAGEWYEGNATTLGMRKMFATGTSVDVKLSGSRSWVEYPEPAAPELGPGGQPIPVSNPADFQRYNPTMQGNATLTLQQPLWRNLGAREVKLGQRLAQMGKIQPEYTVRLYQQNIQAEIEMLYWSILRLDMQIDLTNQLVSKTRRFRKLMEKRAGIGRADQVDVASAQSQVVAREGHQLNLVLAREETFNRLIHRVAPASPDSRTEVKGNLLNSYLKLPEKDAKSAAKAVSGRIDLEMLRALDRKHDLDLELAEEQNSAEINLFGELTGTGKGATGEDAQDALTKGRHPKFTVGLSFEKTLGSDNLRGRAIQATAGKQELRAQQDTIKYDTMRQLNLAFQAIDHGNRKLLQAERAIETHRKHWRAELQKFKQARSEEIVALSYEMEMLSAETARIDALYSLRTNEAKVRHLLHAYPDDSSVKGR